jgi:hypothetical protein
VRIRSTKPEFWSSKTIAAVDWDARLVLKGLESYVDDNGVGRDDIALIVSEVFVRDHFARPRETVARVSEAISQLTEAGLLWRYEADGNELIYISNWDSLQRIDKPNKGRFPRPDGTMNYKESTIRESVARVPETVAPGTGEQGNRGTGEQGEKITATAEPRPRSRFEDFWSLVPPGRKVKRPKAEAAYRAAVKRAGDPQIVIDGMRRYAADPNLPDPKGPEANFIMHPTTWLNGDCWNDPPLPPRMQTGQPGTGHLPGTHPDDWDHPNTAEPPRYVDAEVLTYEELE